MALPTQVLGRRVLARLVDAVLIVALTALGAGPGDLAPASAGALAVLAWLGLEAILAGLTGWTPGKRLLGVRLADLDGAPIGVPRALLRELAWIADGLPAVLPGLVAVLVAARTPLRQRLGDLAAGSCVVRAGERPDLPALGRGALPGAAPPGWYADPHAGSGRRWWDGEGWTDHHAE